MKTITISDIKELNVKATLECGQVFRFIKDSDGYLVFSKDKSAFVSDGPSGAVIKTEHPEYFAEYFRLDEDYAETRRKLATFPELKDAAEAGEGIRLLRQDPFEMLVSFIISANNNIPRIKKIIEEICRRAGKNMGTYYAFPEREELLRFSEKDYVECGAGYRAAYLKEAVKQADGKFFESLENITGSKLTEKLMSVKGVGPKVADCIALFGLSRGDTFPVDTWMEKALKTDVLDTKKKIRDYYLERYGEYAGLAQQYIFNYKRNITG